MVNLLLPVSLFITLIVQNSIAILIDREDFDKFCDTVNKLIDEGDVNPIETINMSINEDSSGDKLQQLTKQSFQLVQNSGGKYNWLASLLSSLWQSQNVAIKLEGTNQTKVGVIGKREINNSDQQLTSALPTLPCNSIPFPSEIDSNDEKSVKLTFYLINNFLDDYYHRKKSN